MSKKKKKTKEKNLRDNSGKWSAIVQIMLIDGVTLLLRASVLL